MTLHCLKERHWKPSIDIERFLIELQFYAVLLQRHHVRALKMYLIVKKDESVPYPHSMRSCQTPNWNPSICRTGNTEMAEIIHHMQCFSPTFRFTRRVQKKNSNVTSSAYHHLYQVMTHKFWKILKIIFG